MSEQTKPMSYWAEKNEKIAAALEAAPAVVAPDAATRLEDALMDQGLVLMPRSTGYGKWRVLVEGQPAPYAGSTSGRPSGPMDAEEAAEAFLLASAASEDVTVRPATSDEMVISAVLGDPVVMPEPEKIAVAGLRVELVADLGGALIRAWDKDGKTVWLALGAAETELLAEVLAADPEEFDARESVPQPCLLHEGDAHYVQECGGGEK